MSSSLPPSPSKRTHPTTPRIRPATNALRLTPPRPSIRSGDPEIKKSPKRKRVVAEEQMDELEVKNEDEMEKDEGDMVAMQDGGWSVTPVWLGVCCLATFTVGVVAGLLV